MTSKPVFGRIRPGTLVFLDHRVYHWPAVPTNSFHPHINPNQRFSFQLNFNGWVEATAPGFGSPGSYGNGGLYIRSMEKKIDIR